MAKTSITQRSIERLERMYKDAVNGVKSARQRASFRKAAAQLKRKAREEEAAKSKLPTQAISSMTEDEIRSTFKLKEIGVDSPEAWDIDTSEGFQIPSTLTEQLEEDEKVFRGAPLNEARLRITINTILRAAFALKDYAHVQSQVERHLKVDMPRKKPTITINGVADYAIWYGNNPNNEANCICLVEAKDMKHDGFPQVLGYMAVVLESRERAGRSHRDIWGIATNSKDWRFLRLEKNRNV